MPTSKLSSLLTAMLYFSKLEPEKGYPGYDKVTGMWTLIITYSSLTDHIRMLTASFYPLNSGYGIITIKEENILPLATLSEIETICETTYFQTQELLEVPLSKEDVQAVTASDTSGLKNLTDAPLSLTGEGVYIGIIDTGFDFAHPALKNEDGSTKFVTLWDQTMPNMTTDLPFGMVFSKEDLHEILLGQKDYPLFSSDLYGHGTAVSGIISKICPKAKLIGIRVSSFSSPDTSHILAAIKYAYDYVEKHDPKSGLIINVSLGNNFGNHLGQSAIETYFAQKAKEFRSCIVVGTGNEGNKNRHASLTISDEPLLIPFTIDLREPLLFLSLYKAYEDTISFTLIAPDGTKLPLKNDLNTVTYQHTTIVSAIVSPGPNETTQQLWLLFYSTNNTIAPGTWNLLLTPKIIRTGFMELWFPSTLSISTNTGFLSPSPYGTFTIPSTTNSIISVGAYAYPDYTATSFSGAGFNPYLGKPDLMAPGVNIRAPLSEPALTVLNHPGKYSLYSGTSFSTPIVSAACALMMEWGLVRGNDPNLYGQKLKAVLRKNAKPLKNSSYLPNPISGFGALYTPVPDMSSTGSGLSLNVT